jgi:hypothetical protein
MKAGRRGFVSMAVLRLVCSSCVSGSVRPMWGDKRHRRRTRHHWESQPRQSRPGEDRRQPLDHSRSGPRRSVHP